MNFIQYLWIFGPFVISFFLQRLIETLFFFPQRLTQTHREVRGGERAWTSPSTQQSITSKLTEYIKRYIAMHWNALVLCIYSKCIGCIFCRIASLDEGARLKWGSCLQVSLIFLIKLWHAQFLDICDICTFWPGVHNVLHIHKPSLQIFSPNALQFVPGANNCGFVHRDRGRHCHNHYFTSTETNNVPICTAATTIWPASPIYRTQSVPRSNLQPHVIVVFCREVAVFGNVGQIIIDFANTDPSCREVAVFGKEDNLVTSFTNPGFLFPCSIAFCPERKEAFILDKR